MRENRLRRESGVSVFAVRIVYILDEPQDLEISAKSSLEGYLFSSCLLES